MEQHGFETLDDFRGHSLQFFTTHADLVKRQAEARAAKKAEHETGWDLEVNQVFA